MPLPELNFLPFESSGVPEEYVRKAELELNETPERRVQTIKELRAIAAAEKGLEVLLERDDDDYLKFLRAKKFDVKRTYDNVKYFINYQRRFSYIFSNRNAEEYLKTGAVKWVQFLPYRCPDGCAIILFKMANWNASVTSLTDLQRFYCFFLATAINDPMTQINGFKIILDYRGHYMQYIRHITPLAVYIIYNGTFNCLPGRFKGVHILYPQLPFKISYTLLKPFLSEKVKSRMFLHDSYKTLLQHFPKQLLPVEYGGDIEEFSNMEWIKKNSTSKKTRPIIP